jgi:hypothetical protein
MTAELLELTRHFTKRGIRVLPFKGPLLAQRLYGDVSARQFSDLDLLVFESDAPRARALLRELGYEMTRERSATLERVYLQLNGAVGFVHSRHKTMVDLHWKIRSGHSRVPGTVFDTAELWAHSGPKRLWGHELRSVAEDHLLLLLAEHGAKHLYTRLGWLCDVGRLLTIGGPWDYSQLMARAKASKCLTSFAVTLLLAAELINVPVPPAALRDVVDNTVRDLKKAVLASMAIGSAGPPPIWISARFRLRLLEDNRDKLEFLLLAGCRSTFHRLESLGPVVGRFAATGVRPEATN